MVRIRSSDALAVWNPQTKEEEVFFRICERSYCSDPERTFSDLNELGLRTLASQLRIEHELGQLRPQEAT